MSNWPEDTFTLCCLMESVLDYDSLSLTTSKTAVTGCKLETNISKYDSSFTWSSKESKGLKKYPLNIKEIKLGDITVKVIITKRYGFCKLYLVSDVNDKRHHALFWRICFAKEKQIERSLCNFSEEKNVYYTGAEIEKYNIQNEIKVMFYITYLAHSLMNYCYTDEKYDIETQSISLELFKIGRTSEEESVYCLQQNFSKLLLDKIFTDVKLRVDDEIMTAHKNVLACRSPVFAAMFEQQMTENNTGIVDIVDVEAKTFSSFLEYIYTGSVKKIDEELALNLLVVADKYDVPSLAKKCSLFLMSVLSNNNLCKVLLIADMVNQKELKSFVVEFILKNSTNILSSPEWLQLVTKNNTLATELLLLISKKFDEQSKISERK
ncbi:protein maternal effect lethal 26 [Parasteatoda tepidariorum]|uniref:protein maternal effect lethal 26 n=1 Tax=Parasteatoda tepidariorum TaxID=114398 RepID=UPI00077F9C28|nr:protein maternal effect lethal 26 [Parasteatoda tepidariorum]